MLIDLPLDTLVDDRYSVIDHIGDGGMGSVFKAREREIDRIIALKLLHPELAPDIENQQRFIREGNLLSKLQHPNVLTFYRFGIWNGDIFYIAMEYLQGQSLSEVIAKETRLTCQRVLNIGIQICSAMAHAHSHNIVHRDLKPGNIMILDDPTGDIVKVVDFGLAKLLTDNGDDIGRMSQQLTQTGCLIGSVQYMSPEQCLGRIADPRSDIYAVGCMLYEALTGETPVIADNPIGVMHFHVNVMAEPPSKRLGKSLPVGLDFVVMRTLAKNPAQRYQSMTDLQADLTSVLAGNGANLVGLNRFTTSTPSSFLFPCSGKYIGAVFILALISVVGWLAQSQSHRPTSQARVELKHSAVKAPMGAPGLASLAALYAKQGRYVDAMPVYQKCLDMMEKSSTTAPHELALIMCGLAQVCIHLDKYSQAESLYKRAVEIIEITAGRDHPETALKLVQLSYCYKIQSKYAEAERACRRALAICEKSGGNNPDVAEILSSLGEIYRAQWKLEEAASVFRRGLEIMEASRGANHSEMAGLLDSLGEAYVVQGRYAEAAALAERAVTVTENTLGPTHPEVAHRLDQLADIYFKQGRYADAENSLTKALAFGGRTATMNYLSKANRLNALATTALAQGKYAQAERWEKEAISATEEPGLNASEKPNKLFVLADIYLVQGKYEEALAARSTALALCEKNLEGRSDLTFIIRTRQLGDLYCGMGKLEEAKAVFSRARKLCEKSLGPDHPDEGARLLQLGDLLRIEGKDQEAEILYKNAIPLVEKNFGPAHPDMAGAYHRLADLCMTRKDFIGAEHLCRKALAIMAKRFPPDHIDRAVSLDQLGRIYCGQKNYTKAEPLLEQALAISRKAMLPPNHPDSIARRQILAGVYRQEGKLAAAEKLKNETPSSASNQASAKESSIVKQSH